MTPSWLDPLTEQPRTKVEVTKADFVVGSVNKLLSLGCNISQAVGVTANAVLESGWGQSLYNHNPFGWKINSTYAKAYKQRTGESAKWFRARGHVRSGDSPEVYYRVFDDYIQAYEEWLGNFVPRSSSDKHRYHQTGKLFWSGGDWFPSLIERGYKGEVTKANPGPSIANHLDLEERVMDMWVQSKLGVAVDGKFGAKSRKALADFQKSQGINANGELDSETLSRLSR